MQVPVVGEPHSPSGVRESGVREERGREGSKRGVREDVPVEYKFVPSANVETKET